MTNNKPTCPTCGSYQHAVRIGDADAVMMQLENIDVDRAGRYVCDHCETLYDFEAQLQVFNRSAKCVHCNSFDTKILSQHRPKQLRYHICKACSMSFRTIGHDIG